MNGEKDELRKRMRALRLSVPEADARRQADAVLTHIRAWPVYRQARTVMAYASVPGELDTAALLDAILSDGKRLALGRCGARGWLDAVAVEDWRALRPTRYGILEPGQEEPAMEPGQIDLVLVPGVAFDRQGGRLGQGKGFFDRFLARTGAVRAGVALIEQMIPAVPCEAHDVRMDYLVTERDIAQTQYGGGWMR